MYVYCLKNGVRGKLMKRLKAHVIPAAGSSHSYDVWMCDCCFLFCDLHLFLQKNVSFFFFPWHYFFGIWPLNANISLGFTRNLPFLGDFTLFWCFGEDHCLQFIFHFLKNRELFFKVFKTFLKMEHVPWLLFLILIGFIFFYSQSGIKTWRPDGRFAPL